ncbi:MAG TPA: HAMP domain-containing sensor histidine kinase [Streptosporangiaceae bacterium]|nr:HAMP domain-containing sensor histidine kinase [Streptosporangiaceae bacterium]
MAAETAVRRAWLPGERLRQIGRAYWSDIAWAIFVGLNLIAMRLIPAWGSVPFLIIWISLTTVYGFRLWRLGSAVLTVSIVSLATGGLIGWQVLRGEQDGDYLAEVPLLAVMFVIVMWHARRRMHAMEEIRRVSEHNLALLDQQRRFLQDVSHELGTPITIALGHAELITHAATDQTIVKDARVAVDELLRMRRLANRLVLLASTDSPDFLHLAPVDAAELLVEILQRWSQAPRRWSLGTVTDARVRADRDRLTVALDALIENAVDHTDPDDRIELSARLHGDEIVLSVRDSGSGIPAGDLGHIFDRFTRVGTGRSRDTGGFGLGLAVVRAIAEAHQGSVRVQSTLGRGSVFDLYIPASATRPSLTDPPEREAAPG